MAGNGDEEQAAWVLQEAASPQMRTRCRPAAALDETSAAALPQGWVAYLDPAMVYRSMSCPTFLSHEQFQFYLACTGLNPTCTEKQIVKLIRGAFNTFSVYSCCIRALPFPHS